MSRDQNPTSDTAPQQRLIDELTAIESIWPEQAAWSDRSREFSYKSVDGRASFILRLPDRYLIDELPEIISANDGKTDLRDHLQQSLRGRDATTEVLDAVLEEFLAMTEREMADALRERQDTQSGSKAEAPTPKATVAVWLHHLLNTNKRKQAITPASDEVSGYSKPGYPGVLLFTGTASAVQAHVSELKSLRWQAFQVRLEVEEEWPLPHQGILEVESMSEVVAGLQPAHQALFSTAIMRV